MQLITCNILLDRSRINLITITPHVILLVIIIYLSDHIKNLLIYSYKVAGTVGLAVSNLRDLQTLIPILNNLGEKHVERGGHKA